jgi:hypothetical protein
MNKAFLFVVLCQTAMVATAHEVSRTAAPSAASFICGGVGQMEQDWFKQQASRHDALLTFATRTGAYIADVDVKVRAKDGMVLAEGRCGGPLMLLDLKNPGTYRIEATFENERQIRNVHIGQQPKRLSFLWPDPPST